MLPNDVVTSDDLARFISQLAEQADAGYCDWENPTLPRFLEAMAAWAEDIESYYRLHGIDMSQESKWRLFADLLMAATMYE